MSSSRLDTPAAAKKLLAIPEEEVVKENRAQSKPITRPIHDLLNARKDVIRQQKNSQASGILKSYSFKLPSSSSGITNALQAKLGVNSRAAEPVSVKPSNIPAPKALTRAATFRTAAPAKSVPPPQILREKVASNPIQPVQPLVTRNIKLEYLEQRFYQKVGSFPSYLQQQIKGPSFTTGWNWNSHFKKLISDFTECTEDKQRQECHDILMKFYWQAGKVDTILEEVRIIFQQGICSSDANPGGFVNPTTSLFGSTESGISVGPSKTLNDRIEGDEIDLLRAGGRGRHSLNVGMMPYLSEIFQHELTKEANYGATWMTKPLTKQDVCTKRNELAKWVCKTAGENLKYPAETAHLAVYLIDAFLHKGCKITSSAMGLLGIAALQIAGKLEEPDPASTSRLIRLSGQFYRADDVIFMEKTMLEKLKFDVYPPLAPLFAQIVIIGGSLSFPTPSIKKLVMDLTQGILHRSLGKHKLSTVSASDKAKTAIEIAVEFVFFQYKLYSQRDLHKYDYVSHKPGREHGDFAVDLCFELFEQRLTKLTKLNARPISKVEFTASPHRDVKV
ncbi:unnamed protein product [Orchesella dallaii]|uniref:Cyclin-like domain-containing protein n=1 Tax=Orchesella dallaii TaxID=48710 RepID=A0ABP1QAD7_9HEXA